MALEAQAAAALEARAGWAALPLAARLEALGRWASGWEGAAAGEREARIASESGLSAEMVSWGARTTCAAWREGAQGLLARSLGGDPGALDAGRAVGAALVGHVWASTLPTSGWLPVVGGLALGGAALIKAPAGALEAARALAASLEDAHPALAGCVQVAAWASGGAQDEALVSCVEGLVVSGGEAATARYAALYAARWPTRGGWVPFGPGWSVAVAPAGSWEDAPAALCAALALDVAAYDQRGCLSPQALWLEGAAEASAARFCEALAEALGRVAEALPRGPLPAGVAAAQMQRQGTAAFLGRAFAAKEALVLWEPTPYRADNPLYRTLPVHTWEGGAGALAARLASQGRLQSAAVAGGVEARRAFAGVLGGLGANRVCSPGSMQTPSASWSHDGMLWLSRLVRFVDEG